MKKGQPPSMPGSSRRPGGAQEQLHVVAARELRQARVQLRADHHRARQVRVHLPHAGAHLRLFVGVQCGRRVSSFVLTTTVRDRCQSTCTRTRTHLTTYF